jgi:hypothetical protein
MVEQCNTELNLGLFPQEVDAVAAVLNRDHISSSELTVAGTGGLGKQVFRQAAREKSLEV